ncbi:hypothetical protein, partial [Legionella gresilensis]|uniref:ApeA N-terminal domain 1-containing protein n=1 Tax=Legionella gresilensis TaxID=91823 RepID=UPI0010418EB4
MKIDKEIEFEGEFSTPKGERTISGLLCIRDGGKIYLQLDDLIQKPEMHKTIDVIWGRNIEQKITLFKAFLKFNNAQTLVAEIAFYEKQSCKNLLRANTAIMGKHYSSKEDIYIKRGKFSLNYNTPIRGIDPIRVKIYG